MSQTSFTLLLLALFGAAFLLYVSAVGLNHYQEVKYESHSNRK